MYCYMYLYINLIRINHVMIYIATPHKKKNTKQYTKIVDTFTSTSLELIL